MAGSRLIQPVLPWLPGGAVEIAPGVGLLTLPDGGGQMWVHGMATFTWDAGDEAAAAGRGASDPAESRDAEAGR